MHPVVYIEHSGHNLKYQLIRNRQIRLIKKFGSVEINRKPTSDYDPTLNWSAIYFGLELEMCLSIDVV